MSTFHRVDHKRAERAPPTEIDSPLTQGQSAVVIVGLSALSWAMLISLVMGLRAVL